MFVRIKSRFKHTCISIHYKQDILQKGEDGDNYNKNNKKNIQTHFTWTTDKWSANKKT